MKFDLDIQGPFRIRSNNIGDPLTLPVAPPAGQSFHWFIDDFADTLTSPPVAPGKICESE